MSFLQTLSVKLEGTVINIRYAKCLETIFRRHLLWQDFGTVLETLDEISSERGLPTTDCSISFFNRVGIIFKCPFNLFSCMLLFLFSCLRPGVSIQ